MFTSGLNATHVLRNEPRRKPCQMTVAVTKPSGDIERLLPIPEACESTQSQKDFQTAQAVRLFRNERTVPNMPEIDKGSR